VLCALCMVGILLLQTFVYSCKPKKTENLEEMARLATRPEAVLVKTVKLEKSTFYHELISNGKLCSFEKAVVPFKINGIIKDLNIQNGQRVKAGDLLAVIEDFDYKTQLLQAKQGLEKAQINFKDDLLSSFSTTDTTLLSPAKIKISRIRSGLNDAITTLSVAEYNYNNTRIFSPISGIVANLDARQWNPSQNYKALCSVFSDESMEVQFNIIECEYGFLKENMPVAIVPFTSDSLQIEGTISNINPQVDDNGMIRVTARFRNNARLIDGMNVKVIIRKPVPNQLVVPKEALVIRQGKDVIFVREDTLAIWKYVTIGAENSTSVSIKDGLSPGDLVIVGGNVNLAHETVVREE
jgi:RND family efflux transporter MFP subunit